MKQDISVDKFGKLIQVGIGKVFVVVGQTPSKKETELIRHTFGYKVSAEIIRRIKEGK